MAQVFISYRRADSQANTDRIYNDLYQAFGRKTIFKDVDDIPLGVDFQTYLADKIQDAQVVLVIIGRTWSMIADENGNRRLDDPHDFVRLEVEAALKLKNARVIPILVNNANMPASGNLPESLRVITQLNAMSVRNDPDFYNDSRRLVRKLRELGIKRVGFSWLQRVAFTMVFASIIILMIMILLSISNNRGNTADVTPTNDEFTVAQEASTTPIGDTEMQVDISTEDSTPTDEPTLTNTPDAIAVAEQVLQQQTAQAVINNSTATAVRQTQDIELQQTELANLTATATQWTQTPTPNITASVEAVLTSWAIETATQNAANLTAIATLWTPTLTHTPTPTAGLTNTAQPTLAPSSIVPVESVTAIVNVELANLREGPGTHYNRAGTAASGTALSIIARTQDNDWYLVRTEDDEIAWIWSGIVNVSISDLQIEIAVTIPAAPPTLAVNTNCTSLQVGCEVIVIYGYSLCNQPFRIADYDPTDCYPGTLENQSVIVLSGATRINDGASTRDFYRVRDEDGNVGWVQLESGSYGNITVLNYRFPE